jgi:CRP-like cAMP-binding protein
MYFVIAGEVEIRTGTGAQLNTIRAGGFFGDIGVLFAGKRAACAVVSSGPCRLAVLNRRDLVQVATKHRFLDELHDRGQALQHVRLWFVSQLPLFASCAEQPGFLSRVADALVVQKAKSGQAMIREGAEGHSMFFIFDGEVSVTTRRGGPAVRLVAPQSFGELAMLYSESRSATITCTSDCRFYKLERAALNTILQDFPAAISAIYSSAQEAASLKAHFIKKIPLFEQMSHDEEFVANMSMALESSSAAPGEYLVQQNAASDGKMFAIAHGHAEVLKVKHADEPASIVSTLHAGSFFGEVALLLDTPRLASVVARGHCHVYTLSRDAFETLAVVYEDWWHKITSEHGVLLQQIKGTGVGISATATTKTHGLHIPKVDGIPASAMLCSAESRPVVCGVPEERLCVVCLEREKTMLSVPCGHIAACRTCHEPLSSCPLCRTAIQGGHQAFF